MNIVCVVLSTAVLSATVNAQHDFYELRGDFEFIYHELHNLILTVFKNDSSCYFSSTENKAWTFIEQFKQVVEMQVMTQIVNHIGIEPSTAEELRNMYHDIVADYRCLAKPVNKLNISYSGEVFQILGYDHDLVVG